MTAETSEPTANKMLSMLTKEFPDAGCALHHKTALQLLIATILSAQCTDKRVNIVTRELFKKYRKAKDYAEADLEKLEQDIKSTGFYRMKAKNIKAACRIIHEKHKGTVPDKMEDLLELPGVARKTANVVLGVWFKKNEGVVVDTHVKRISQRLGLTENKDPNKIEKDLMQIFPRKDWTKLSLILIEHGRKTCKAPKPLCPECVLNKICPSSTVKN